MGKRKKSSRSTGAKKKEPLSTTFTCVFCNHEKAIQVKMDRKLNQGQLRCKICGQSFSIRINYLDSPIDVYAGWIDACEEVAQAQAAREQEEGSQGEGEGEGAEEPGVTAADKEFSNYGTRVDGADDDEDY